ncbi:hypothetical protein Ddye_017985 [Dipteronia dyeriana]|uniref:Uncharacterized protein n=1 Tax=Dipteronia dyeriana TaxID=168575 RepID=A0AAD9UA84_9ROSI|nr:hypothetical protein Ddye_017985 [Dipteronia dyeriana]
MPKISSFSVVSLKKLKFQYLKRKTQLRRGLQPVQFQNPNAKHKTVDSGGSSDLQQLQLRHPSSSSSSLSSSSSSSPSSSSPSNLIFSLATPAELAFSISLAESHLKCKL